MIPTERFVLARGGYVEQPPHLEYRPMTTTLESELGAKLWAAGAVRGGVSLAIGSEKTVESQKKTNSPCSPSASEPGRSIGAATLA